MIRPEHKPLPLSLLPDVVLGPVESVTITVVSLDGSRGEVTYRGEDLQSWIHHESTVRHDPRLEDRVSLYPPILTNDETRYHAVLVIQQAEGLTATYTNATQEPQA